MKLGGGAAWREEISMQLTDRNGKEQFSWSPPREEAYIILLKVKSRVKSAEFGIRRTQN